jgi:hypothetical protein
MWEGNHTTTFKDANLMHCTVSGKSCTGIILHMLNQIPIEWFSKRQNIPVDTTIYGCEDICYTLCALGFPLDGLMD